MTDFDCVDFCDVPKIGFLDLKVLYVIRKMELFIESISAENWI